MCLVGAMQPVSSYAHDFPTQGGDWRLEIGELEIELSYTERRGEGTEDYGGERFVVGALAPFSGPAGR